MGARFVMLILLTLLVLVQAQIWFGRGSIADVSRLRATLATQMADNQRIETSNQQLAAEVHDLQNGGDSVEAEVRLSLGMIKSGEIFVQVSSQ